MNHTSHKLFVKPIQQKRAPYNRTLQVSDEERLAFLKMTEILTAPAGIENINNRIFRQDMISTLEFFPDSFIDLLFIDPPYNLRKQFDAMKFQRSGIEQYAAYLDSWLSKMIRLLRPSASIYICGDYRSSTSIHIIAEKYFKIRNRITWQREKGRGAKSNWKNSSEDIWFCTVSDNYTFNVDSVKERRKVLAPYRQDGKPKDWDETSSGKFRDTHPSNIWTDISVPFWSMPENTDHPTQKPEKLLAKIILASTNEGDMVFDPFLGSGTTAVTAKKLNRCYCGIEINENYCAYSMKRLMLAESDNTIQGYSSGVFWERNTLSEQIRKKR